MGRPQAKMATNHQYPGLAAETTVSVRPYGQRAEQDGPATEPVGQSR